MQHNQVFLRRGLYIFNDLLFQPFLEIQHGYGPKLVHVKYSPFTQVDLLATPRPSIVAFFRIFQTKFVCEDFCINELVPNVETAFAHLQTPVVRVNIRKLPHTIKLKFMLDRDSPNKTYISFVRPTLEYANIVLEQLYTI